MKKKKLLQLVLGGILFFNIATLPFAMQGAVFAQGRAEDPFGRGDTTTDDTTTDDTTTDTPSTTEAAPGPSVGDAISGGADAADEAGGTSGTAKDVCDGIKATGGDCEVSEDDTTVRDIIALVINILSIMVGVAAVIMIIVNGFRFVISNGDATAVGAAKNGIIYAIIGLVIVAMAQVIVQFVINRAITAGDEPVTTNHMRALEDVS